MNYVDECNEYAVAAAKIAGKYEFLIKMQDDIRRIFMQEPESISEYELRQQEEAEHASYLAQMEGESVENLKRDLKPFGAVIQICGCGHVDAYKDDGHTCGVSALNSFNMNEDYKW